MLAYITGSVDQELLLRNEYLATENGILKNQIKGRLRLTDSERISLADTLANVLAGKPSRRWRKSFGPRPYWRGIGNWSPRSLTAPRIVWVG